MVEVVVHLRKGERTVTAMGVREDIVKARSKPSSLA